MVDINLLFHTKDALMEMTVVRINDQGDRILFYGEDGNFHVIGSRKSAPDVTVGDKISYERPAFSNFGWFKAKIVE